MFEMANAQKRVAAREFQENYGHMITNRPRKRVRLDPVPEGSEAARLADVVKMEVMLASINKGMGPLRATFLQKRRPDLAAALGLRRG